MTATDVVVDQVERASVPSDLGPAFGRLTRAAVHAGVAKLSHKTDEWIGGLEEYVASQGAAERAGYEGLKARLLGKNPVWAALKGAWWGASPPLRLVAVLVVMLVLVLAPVVLLLLLLGLLVAAIVSGIRAATK